MQRMSYYPYSKNNKISCKNEPFYLRGTISDEIICYPDMYTIYQKFSQIFNVPTDNFILCNGAENAFRAAVLCLANPLYQSKIAIENPGWGLAKVICESMNIPYKEYSLHIPTKTYTGYNKKDIMFQPDNVTADVLYETNWQNNDIFHEFVEKKKYNYRILDETYNLEHLRIGDYKTDGKTIVIGSFSKFCGAGLRLGYALFPDLFSHKMQLLREQYINSEAVRFIFNFDINKGPESIIPDCTSDPLLEAKFIPFNVYAWHPTYITVQAETLPFPHKHFVVDGVPFCRFGRPKNKEMLKEMFKKEG